MKKRSGAFSYMMGKRIAEKAKKPLHLVEAAFMLSFEGTLVFGHRKNSFIYLGIYFHVFHKHGHYARHSR